MRMRLLIAVLCLCSLFAELALDSSTFFVRANPSPVVGKLVIMKEFSNDDQSPTQPDEADGSVDLHQFGGAPCHAGQVIIAVSLNRVVLVSNYIPFPGSGYLEPRISDLQNLRPRFELLPRTFNEIMILAFALQRLWRFLWKIKKVNQEQVESGWRSSWAVFSP